MHYSTTIIPARSYKPRDKALVENAVKIVYYRIFAELRDRVFYSIEEFNDAISSLLETYNGIKLQNRDYSRSDLFKETDQKELQALASEKYEIKEYARLHDSSHGTQNRTERKFYEKKTKISCKRNLF